MTAYKYQKQHASNYNYKGKRSFGQRIKNFFTIPEEDLKEEPSKEFEKIKLFTLTRGSLFLGILVFMILINILVGFNINFLYLRQILGFLFLILIPGLLIMLCFKIRTVKFWEYLVYTVGLSIAFIMFAGLAVNWTLPALGITDKPLSLWPILICFDIFLLGLWLTAIYRNKDLKPFDITIPKLDTLNRIFFTIPMVFPLLSILGAFLLNNHGPNILTMIMLGGIAVYVLFLVIFRKHMNENVWPWALWMIGLALLLMFSMRSWFISGHDILTEFKVFKITYENYFWSINNLDNAYNSCLSITIFPTILYSFTDITSQLLFKFTNVFIFSFFSLVIYITGKKFFRNSFCFLSVFFILSQRVFFLEMPMESRQSISLLFFSIAILTSFNDKIDIKIRRIFFILFGASMIVSHYSTAYIALTLFVLTYFSILFYKLNENNKIKKGKLNKYDKSEFYLTGLLILFLLIFGFFWYSQITNTSDGIISYASKTIGNINNLFKEDLKGNDVSIYSQFDIFYVPQDSRKFIGNYSREVLLEYESLDLYETKDQQVTAANTQLISSNLSYTAIKYIYTFSNLIKKLVKIFIIFGCFIILFIIRKRINIEWVMESTLCLLLLFLMIVLPVISTGYGLERFYVQILTFLCFSAVLGGSYIFNLINKKLYILFVSITFLIFFLFSSGFLTQIIGGSHADLNLNNYGKYYDNFYTYKTDKYAVSFIDSEEIDHSIIYADTYNHRKILAFGENKDYYIFEDMLPFTITKNSYVFIGHTNIIKNKMSKAYKIREGGTEIFLELNPPLSFLQINKNKIYTNGGEYIFR